MENKTVDNTASPLTTEPQLVEAIVAKLTKDMEVIESLLKKDNFFDNN